LTSYLLQEKKIEAIHETVISIFAGERPESGSQSESRAWLPR
jgi:hypothetical protein